jgi:FkbM family methyltransferase
MAFVTASDLGASFGGLRAVLAGDGWRAWTPRDQPLPATASGRERCKPGSLHFQRGRRRLEPPQQMCLVPPPDVISDAIRSQHRWRDCGKIVRLWHNLDGRVQVSRSAGPTGVLVEVGSNIVAFEPSPSNLFYLTRSLRMAAERLPDITNRVVVLPLGVGDQAQSSVPFYVEANNSGNSVLGRAFTSVCPRDDAACWQATMLKVEGSRVKVETLAHIFPDGLGRAARVLKLDAQGWECKILQGLRNAHTNQVGQPQGPPPLDTSALTIVTELAPGWLGAQCCGMRYLQHLTRLGPDWRVTCSSKAWAETSCVSHPPHANASRLPASVVGSEVIPPLNRSEVESLQASMARCRKGDANLNLTAADMLPFERPCCSPANIEVKLGTEGRCRWRKAKGLCRQIRAGWVREYCPATCGLCRTNCDNHHLHTRGLP